MVKVSVIMPAYNAAAFIVESIKSVLAQTYQNWELIVIDDGSTDDTNSIVQEFVLFDNRIRYFFQENGRQGKARNMGIRLSTGMLIAFLDADDIWEPYKLQFQIDLLSEKKVDLVFGNFNILDGKSRVGSTKYEEGYYNGIEAFRTLSRRNTIGILTVLCKKSILNEVGGFSEKPDIQNAEDFHLWLRLIIVDAKFFCHARPVAIYRVHALGSTMQDRNATIPVCKALKDLEYTYKSLKKILRAAVKLHLKRYLFDNTFTGRDQILPYITLINSVSKVPAPAAVYQTIYLLLGDRALRKILIKII